MNDPSGPLHSMIDLPQPRPFGTYFVHRLLGEGAMGLVYLASNPVLARFEALKVIRSKWRKNEEAIKRFRAEMARMANLKHPHIVSVYHTGEVSVCEAGRREEQLFFTMSYEDGGDLKSLLDREGPLDPVRAAKVVRSIAEAVAEAHRQQPPIIHRDLKPSNVLLRKTAPGCDDFPLVTDFGLAVLMSPATGGAGIGSGPEGTPCYMAPEQADRKDIDSRSDVWALGAILYELLTGRPPFQGRDSDATLELVRRAPLDPPGVLIRTHYADRPALPPSLEAICLKCLEKDPQRRYASAGELAGALDEFLRPPRRPPLSRRAKVGVGLAALAVLALLLVGVRFWEEKAAADEARDFVRNGDVAREKATTEEALQHYANASSRYDKLLASWLPRYGRAGLRLDRAAVQIRQATLLEEQKEHALAEAAIKAALKELEELWPHLSDEPRYLSVYAEAYHQDGVQHSDRGAREEKGKEEGKKELEKGVKSYEKAIDHNKQLLSRWPKHPDERLHRRNLALNYGFLGDVHRTLGNSELAKKDYREAAEIRDNLAEKTPHEPEAICLHARDFGNFSALHDWNDELGAAIAKARERLEYYEGKKDVLPRPLPGPYLTERAETSVTLAELELDRPEGPAPDVKDLLDAALAEYQSFPGAQTPGPENPFQSDLAWLYVLRGKYHGLQRDAQAARKDLEHAREIFKGIPETKVTFNERYRWAQAHALLGALTTKDARERTYHFVSALVFLEQALRSGFQHYHRLKRDVAFEELRKSEWHERYKQYEQDLAERREFAKAKTK